MSSLAIQSVIGHNNPPSEAEMLQAQLAQRQAVILSNTGSLLESVSRAPQACDSDETAEKITTLIKLITTNAKALEGARIAEKAPFLSSERVIDNFFKSHADKLDAAKKKITLPLNGWLQKKADEERRAREAAAKTAQEQAARELAAAVTLDQSGMSQFSDSAMAQAAITEQNANKLALSATAKPAALASVRSIGGTASLRTEWKSEITDRATLDLEALRQHIPAAALQQAVDSYVRAGGRVLAGAIIKEVSSAVVR